MAYLRYHPKRNEYPEPKTKKLEWPAKKGNFVTLVLASLAISSDEGARLCNQMHRQNGF